MKKLTVFLAVFCAVISTFVGQYTLASADELFKSNAKATYLMDVNSNQVLYKNNEDLKLPIASMTKIMLLDIVFEEIENGNLSQDEKITVSKTASGMGGSQVFLQADKQYLVSELIKSVIVASANDSSVALAERISGSELHFVEKMNDKAKKMGLNNTNFVNCTGLPAEGHFSSAKDVSYMLKSLITHKDYFKYSSIWLEDFAHPDGTFTTITNTNKLTKFFDGCDGGKTGFTTQSKYCLAATAKRDNMRLIAVVIGEESSKTRFKDVSDMFKTAFNCFESKIIVDKNQPCADMVKIKGAEKEYYNAYPKIDLAIFTRKNQKVEYSYQTSYNQNITAPIKKGDSVGVITLYVNGVEYSSTDLIVQDDINRINFKNAIEKVAQNW